MAYLMNWFVAFIFLTLTSNDVEASISNEKQSANKLASSESTINNFLAAGQAKVINDSSDFKENLIEAVFKRVAYGPTTSKKLEKSNDGSLNDYKRQKQISQLLSPKNRHFLQNKEKSDHSNAPEVSGVIYNAFPQSLMREVPLIRDENFTLFQLNRTPLQSDAEKKMANNYQTDQSVKDVVQINNYDVFENNKTENNLTDLFQDTSSEPSVICEYKSNIRLQGHLFFIMIGLFCLLAIYLLIIAYRINVSKRRHVAPYFSSFIMADIIVVCLARIFLYVTNIYFSDRRIITDYMPYLLKHGLWGLNHAVGMYTVILIFPIFRPNSLIIPRIFCASLSFMFMCKMLTSCLCSLFCSYYDCHIQNNTNVTLAAINIAEISAIFVSTVTLNVFTKQRHKIWWIRMYKNTVCSSGESFHVLYSQLRKSIRIGSIAACLQLINTVLFNISEFGIKLNNLPFKQILNEDGIEVLNRILEISVGFLITLGVSLLFACSERSIIRKKTLLKKVVDVVKGKRVKNSVITREDFRLPLSIFTVNKTSKTPDSVTSDFQLVWNNDRTLNSSKSFSGENKQNSTTLIPCKQNSNKRKPFSHSYSVGALKNIDQLSQKRLSKDGESKILITETPLHKNSIFQYGYTFGEPDLLYRVPKTSLINNHIKRTNKKKPKQTRPKSLILTGGGKSEPYSTAYVSALSQENFMELDDLGIFLGSRNTIVDQTFNPTNQRQRTKINSMDSAEGNVNKYNILSLQKRNEHLCKNDRNKLQFSKSFDLF